MEHLYDALRLIVKHSREPHTLSDEAFFHWSIKVADVHILAHKQTCPTSTTSVFCTFFNRIFVVLLIIKGERARRKAPHQQVILAELITSPCREVLTIRLIGLPHL